MNKIVNINRVKMVKKVKVLALTTLSEEKIKDIVVSDFARQITVKCTATKRENKDG